MDKESNEPEPRKTYNQRYEETNQLSTDEIRKILKERKDLEQDTGVLEGILKERTGEEYQEEDDGPGTSRYDMTYDD